MLHMSSMHPGGLGIPFSAQPLEPPPVYLGMGQSQTRGPQVLVLASIHRGSILAGIFNPQPLDASLLPFFLLTLITDVIF